MNFSNSLPVVIMDMELDAFEAAKTVPIHSGEIIMGSLLCVFLAHEVQLGREMKFECV